MNKIQLLNYTTTVSEAKSIEAIRMALVACGATTVAIEHTDNLPTCLRFNVVYGSQAIIFVIDCKTNFIKDILQEAKIPQKYKTDAHAMRVAWRLIKSWVDVQLSFVRLGWRTMEESFLPYAEIARGITFYKTLEVKGLKQLYEPIA